MGLALAQAWLDQGAPAPFTLAECGPGRGTLMADLLRATRGVPGFHAAMRLHLVEASPALRAVQRATLGRDDVTWLDEVADLPEAPLFLIANEFFDALPIRQFIRAGAGAGWCERCVGVSDGKLVPEAGAPTQVAQLARRLEDTREGDVVEICAAGEAAADVIGARIAAHGGAALIVDYGGWRTLGDTFQAVRRHQRADPFEAPGMADLTAHVDFEALARAAAPAKHTRPTPQGVVLERLGVTARAQVLAKALEGEALESHIAAHRRLTHPQEMGTLFQVLGLYPPNAAPPPGCDA